MDKTCRRSRKDYPNGVLGIYDNGGLDRKYGSCDRYIVVYAPFEAEGKAYWPYVCMSGAPFHPQGICMHAEANRRISGNWGSYRGAGRCIDFKDLPADCQRVVHQDLEDDIDKHSVLAETDQALWG